MNKSLFFCIGNRDLQGVYELAQQGSLRRKAIQISFLRDNDLLSLEAYPSEGIKEPQKDDPRLDNLVGITFPMLCKTLSYLQDKGVTHLDRVFLIATHRSGILPKLKQIKESWEQNLENINSLYEYLEEGLIPHAEHDTTSVTAHFIAKRITERTLPLFGITITEVVVLDLGSYGSFRSTLALDPAKRITEADLAKADINTLDFFEAELYQALRPYFRELENSRIFLGTHSGGMPLMQRGLDNVLFSVVSFADYARIFTSEYLSYQVDNRQQGRFLQLMKQMNDNVIRLDWETAYDRFLKIKTQYKDNIDSSTCKTLENIFNRVLDVAASGNLWFERYVTLIFRALYAMNWNDAVVWLKCLEEAVYISLIQAQCGTLWKEFRDHELVILNSVTFGRDTSQKAPQKLLAAGVDIASLRKALGDYACIFLDSADLTDNSDWVDLRSIRNKLIHNAIPVAAKKKNISLLLSFIKVDLSKLKDAVTSLQNKDISAVRAFEAECLNNDFFKPLGAIAGFKADVLFERKQSERYLDALHEKH